MIVILPKRVSLLADQLSKILLIFSIFSIKLELRDPSSKVENHTFKGKNLSFGDSGHPCFVPRPTLHTVFGPAVLAAVKILVS